MKREFAINIALLLVANLMIKVFYLLGIDRHVQLSLGTDDYGLYYKLLNFTLIFQFINDFGIQNYTNRHVSQNRVAIRHQYQDFAGVKVGLSLIYAVVLLVFAWILGYEKAVFPLILHLGFNQILVSAILFARSNISGLGYYRIDSLLSVLDRILLIGMGSLLLWHTAFQSYLNINGFVWVQTLSLSLTLTVCLILLSRYHLRLAFRWMHWDAIRPVLKACMPFALIYLFTTLYNKIDVLLIARMLEDGNREAGIYAASMRLYEAFSMISLAFGSLLLAMFSALETKREQLAELFRAAMNLLAVMTICIVVTGVFYSQEIMERLYHQDDPYWTRPFVWILLAFLPGSLNYIYGAYYPAVHEENRLVRFYAWSFGFNLLANLALIPILKVEGAAISALITQSLLFGLQLWHSTRSGIRLVDYSFWMRILSFCLLAACIVYGSTLLPGNWMLKGAGCMILLPGVAGLLGLIRLRELLAARAE